ncbi:MAG: ketoacyl-ACP synthase III [Spirochaetales bacterium]|nr:ketoacyl-ACP synthase III [Spirochaetales bacterium]
MLSKAKISGLGAYVPPKKLTNFDLEKMVDTTNEWIIQRTGIQERRISEPGDFASHLAIEAVRDLHDSTGFDFREIDYIIVASFTPDFYTPSIAAIVHGAYDFKEEVGVVDINAACAGFVQGLFMANSFITSGIAKKVIVIGAETISKIVDYTDRNSCVLFGDGASAVLVEEAEQGNFLAYHYGAIGKDAHKISCSGLSHNLNGNEMRDDHIFWQDGRAVYTFTIRTVPQGMRLLLEKAGLTNEKLDWFVPHSANLRIIHSICEKLELPKEKALMSVEEYGNTSSASIPLALWQGIKQGKLKKGDTLALYGFGGGLNYAGLVVRW